MLEFTRSTKHFTAQDRVKALSECDEFVGFGEIDQLEAVYEEPLAWSSDPGVEKSNWNGEVGKLTAPKSHPTAGATRVRDAIIPQERPVWSEKSYSKRGTLGQTSHVH